MRTHSLPLSLAISASLLASGGVRADDLDEMLSTSAPANEPVTATFKSIRVIQGQSVETTGGGVLNLTISHRMGPFGTGPEGFFGLDFARIRLGVDYGLTDRTDVGLERSNNDGKPVSLWLKQRLLQQTNTGSMPVSVTWFSEGYCMTEGGDQLPYSLTFERRLSSTHQLIVARKFSDKISVQVAPTLVTRQLRPLNDDGEYAAGVGIGGRYKLTNRFALTAEGTPMFYGVASNWDPSMAFGVDMETGGHVFQIFISNSGWLSEDRLYTQTKGGTDSPVDGGSLSFGFNLTRGFGIGKSLW